MKALKTIGIIALAIIVIIGYTYAIFFKTSSNVQAIMEKHKKEKAAFESEIVLLNKKQWRSLQEINEQAVKIAEAENKQKVTEVDRLAWKEKYDNAQKKYEKIKETNKPKNEAEFKALNEEQKVIEYGKLKINLDVTESRLIECENGLHKNNALVIEYKVTLNLQASQIKNFENDMALKIEKIVEMELELNRRETTIQELNKVSTKINFKKAAIYTGIVFVVIKLLQVIFPK